MWATRGGGPARPELAPRDRPGRTGAHGGSDADAPQVPLHADDLHGSTTLLELAPRPVAPRIAPLLDVDPELGRLLDDPRREAARRDIAVRLVQVRRGLWPVDRLAATDARHLGLVVVDGLIARSVLVDDVSSLELLGPGDVLRPWLEALDSGLLPTAVRWSALADSRLALLDRRAAERLAAYPEIHAALLERTALRAHRLSTTQALNQVRRVDRRLLLLLWHLAERWGKVTPAGVALPLALSHRVLAELIGARRPTVSTALGELLRTGEVARGGGGTWILTGAPAEEPDGAARVISQRRAALAVD